jgi:hypothetical protein
MGMCNQKCVALLVAQASLQPILQPIVLTLCPCYLIDSQIPGVRGEKKERVATGQILRVFSKVRKEGP